MDAEQLKTLQTPLKAKYRDDPESARVLMRATGAVDTSALACRVPTFAGEATAGLHPAAGGNGTQACSGDMLLEALVACSGVTFAAVATAMSIPIRSANVAAEAEMDFRGTLGVDRETPVGITRLSLEFTIDSAAEDSQLEKLVQLVERYCVVLQTLARPATLSSGWKRS